MNEKKSTDAQIRASAKYRKEKVKRLTVDFSPLDSDLWGLVQAQPNKQGYIKSLIRADLEKGR